MNRFDFKGLLKHLDINQSEFHQRTGIAMNTITKWKRQDSDARIYQESILKILTAFPNVDLKPFMPTYKAINNWGEEQDM